MEYFTMEARGDDGEACLGSRASCSIDYFAGQGCAVVLSKFEGGWQGTALRAIGSADANLELDGGYAEGYGEVDARLGWVESVYWNVVGDEDGGVAFSAVGVGDLDVDGLAGVDGIVEAEGGRQGAEAG